MRQRTIVMLAVVLLAVLPLSAQRRGVEAPPQPRGAAALRPGMQNIPGPQGDRLPGIPIKVQNLRAGDILARGNRVPRSAALQQALRDSGRQNGRQTDDCQFDFGIQTPYFSTGDYTIDWSADEDCVARVNWIDDRTDSALVPQAQLAQRPRSQLAVLFERLGNWFVPKLSAAVGPKRVVAYEWTYGLGGEWDMLTEERGFNDFSWDGSYAWLNAAYGYCDTSHLVQWWWMNGCWIWGVQYNGSTTYRLDQGNYFWAPAGLGGPWYYVHRLWNYREGNSFGYVSCSGWWEGSIFNSNARFRCFEQMPPPCGVGVICFTPAPHTTG